jgi:PAS domain-containing protein
MGLHRGTDPPSDHRRDARRDRRDGIQERVQAHTFLAVQATAALIEQRLLLEFTLDEKLLCDRLFARANRMPADAMLAVDRRGRVVQLNAAAERLLTVRRPSGGQTLRDELGPVVEAAWSAAADIPKGTSRPSAPARSAARSAS